MRTIKFPLSLLIEPAGKSIDDLRIASTSSLKPRLYDSSFGILAVHGFYPKQWETKGFEWASPLQELTKLKKPIWWVKYDWFDCPDSSVQYLSKKIDSLITDNPNLDSLWVIGHSLGGYIVSNLAEKWNNDFH